MIYENDIGNYWATATEMLVVVGGTSIALSKLMEMTATEVVGISETLEKFKKGGSEVSYDSFNAFKKANPVKTLGNQWHHIVEQNQIQKSGFSVQQINNTNNLIELTSEQHAKVSGFYSSKLDFTGGLTVRNWLSEQSFETQYQFGINKLREFGFIK